MGICHTWDGVMMTIYGMVSFNHGYHAYKLDIIIQKARSSCWSLGPVSCSLGWLDRRLDRWCYFRILLGPALSIFGLALVVLVLLPLHHFFEKRTVTCHDDLIWWDVARIYSR